jgi:hypothetical protein
MREDRRAAVSCAVAFFLRLAVPIAFVVLVGVFPIWYLELEPLAAIAWFFLSVIAIPTAVMVAVVLRARRGRDRSR